MALSYVGLIPFTVLCPVVNLSIGFIGIGLGASLSGNLALNAQFTVTPPTASYYISAGADFEADLAFAIAAIPPVPSFSFQVSDCVTLNAKLEAAFGFLASLDALLEASIGAFAFAYSGVANAMGTALTTELATQWPDGTPTSGNCNALILAATSSRATPQLPAFLNGLSYGSGLVYTGKLGLSAITPLTLSASSQGEAGIQFQLAAAAKLSAAASIPAPSFAVMATAKAKAQANLKAAVSVSPPQASIAATASAAANLSAKFGALAQLGLAFGNAGATFYVFTYSGPADALGAAVTTELATQWPDPLHPPTTGATVAAILGATDSATWDILSSFFGAI